MSAKKDRVQNLCSAAIKRVDEAIANHQGGQPEDLSVPKGSEWGVSGDRSTVYMTLAYIGLQGGSFARQPTQLTCPHL
jgi:hypothetical protein